MIYFCIISYKRAEICAQKSLAFLLSQNIPLDQIHIFVGGCETDLQEYKNSCNADVHFHLVPPGMQNARNAVYDFFPPETKILMMDDDVRGLLHKSAPSYNFLEECQRGFDKCTESKCSLFGFYPVANKLFMNDRIKKSCLFIYGCCFGIINCEYREIMDFKDDWYRSCWFFERDGGVLRIEYLAPLQSFRKQTGGLALTRTIEKEQEGLDKVLALYPDLVAVKKTKTLWPELRMKKNVVCLV